MAPAEPLMPMEMAPETPRSSRSSLSRASRSFHLPISRSSSRSSGLRARLGLMSVARRTLGIVLLLVTVFLWTASNFLASYIFSDHSYSKPFFVVYINTSMFAISLIPISIHYVMRNGVSAVKDAAIELWKPRWLDGAAPKTEEQEADEAEEEEQDLVGSSGRLLPEGRNSLDTASKNPTPHQQRQDKLTLRETAWLSLEFCMLWFLANYFASACLEYTSVGSVTILTSTSSVWTLILCAVMRVEGFTVRKLAGVLASLAGVVLISSVDLSGSSDENRGNFPHKTQGQIAIGDAMAFVSAIIYGIYVTVMKRRVGNEDRVNMPLFFGLVGLFNVVFLWPVFPILHFTGIETFEMPPSGKVWTIIILNSISSFISDMSWAYAMLLTTPLVVTVGLSLTIPLSLIGEMIQYSQYSSWVYWVGAGIVFISFLFINHESHEEGEDRDLGNVEESSEGSELDAVSQSV